MKIKEKSAIERIIGETIKSVELGKNGKNVEIVCQSGVVFLLEPEYPEETKVTSFMDSVEVLVGFVVKDARENGYYVNSLTGTEDHTLYEIETEKGIAKIKWCGFSETGGVFTYKIGEISPENISYDERSVSEELQVLINDVGFHDVLFEMINLAKEREEKIPLWVAFRAGNCGNQIDSIWFERSEADKQCEKFVDREGYHACSEKFILNC